MAELFHYERNSTYQDTRSFYNGSKRIEGKADFFHRDHVEWLWTVSVWSSSTINHNNIDLTFWLSVA
jgi:hypothetical protein